MINHHLKMRSSARAGNAVNHFSKNNNDADCDHYHKISDWAGKAFNNYPGRYVNYFSKTRTGRNDNDAADHYDRDVGVRSLEKTDRISDWVRKLK